MTTTNQAMRVPYGQTVHGEEEIAAVVEVLRTSTQMGTRVRTFESRIAELFAKRHGVMVNSGSSALYLATELLALPAGAEVVTPVLTFATTVAPLVKAGLVPSFVDVEPDTFNIDVSKIEAGDGELRELKPKPKKPKDPMEMSAYDRTMFFAELKGYAFQHGYKPGWAAQKYRDRFGKWPANDMKNILPMAPKPSTASWIKSEQIRWAKSKAKENRVWTDQWRR